MTATRLASQVDGGFPFGLKTVCWMVLRQGELTCVSTREERDLAYLWASRGYAKLYAVWPGKWRSDLFELDDLDAVARALGLKANA